MIINESDFIIAVGVRLGLRQIGHYHEKFAPNAYLVRADIDQSELARTIKSDEEKVLIDANDFLQRLMEEDIPDYSDWAEKCFKLRDFLDGYDDVIGNLALKKISSMLPENPIVAVDVGQHQCWSAQSLTLKGDKGRILISGGYGSMGCALPYAIGASISQNYCKVFCVTGDGGLQMNIQELETIIRENIPVKILVINNHVLGKISEVQEKSYNSAFAQTTESSGFSVPDFKKIAIAYGIKWFASAWDIPSQEFLDKYDLEYNKIASAMITNLPFILSVAKKRKLTFISTGMTTYNDIDNAIKIFEEENCPYVLMYCVSIYPTPNELLNLSMINTLREKYNCEVGYSCHHKSILPAALSVMYGVKYIEKHITLDRTMYGSDQSASIEPKGMLMLRGYVDTALESIGDGIKTNVKGEDKIANKLRYWKNE